MATLTIIKANWQRWVLPLIGIASAFLVYELLLKPAPSHDKPEATGVSSTAVDHVSSTKTDTIVHDVNVPANYDLSPALPTTSITPNITEAQAAIAGLNSEAKPSDEILRGVQSLNSALRNLASQPDFYAAKLDRQALIIKQQANALIQQMETETGMDTKVERLKLKAKLASVDDPDLKALLEKGKALDAQVATTAKSFQ